ncbi:MAG: flavodoxin domain-containing protein, partial [Chloroflexi bacterium]|nr:flavodoxin domain-containing protein [Chloroflexota bacterium]
IAQQIRSHGVEVDVCPVKEVTTLDGYSAVIVGSMVRIGKWMPEALKFVETHRSTLAQKPTALFTVCMTLAEDNETNRQQVLNEFMAPVRGVVEPRSIGLFGGVMNLEQHPFLLRFMLQKMNTPRGDFRNWDAIRAWADEIYPVLTQN